MKIDMIIIESFGIISNEVSDKIRNRICITLMALEINQNIYKLLLEI